MPEITINSDLGKKAPTREIYQLRCMREVNLKLQGRSWQSILEEVNKEAETKKWGVISLSQLKKDVAKYFNYKIHYNQGEAKEIEEGEKQAYISDLERNMQTVLGLIMKAIYYYNNEEEEKAKGAKRPVYARSNINVAWVTLLEMGKHLCKLQGWEKMPEGFNVNFQNITNELNIYDRGNEAIAKSDTGITRRVAELLENIFEKDTEQDGREIISGMGKELDSSHGNKEVAVSKS